MNNSNQPFFESLGLQQQLRSNMQHAYTHGGMHVEVGDILWLVLVNVSAREDNEPEEAITMVKVADGTDTCTAGFVPLAFACLEQIIEKFNNCCIILEQFQ
jgi:hypothetical protein